jgi:hypothetical protein
MLTSRRSILLGLGWNAAIRRGAAAPADVLDEEVFADLDFPVSLAYPVDVGVYRAECRRTLAGRVVGFAVTFHAPWKRVAGSDVSMYMGKIVLSRTGVESDAFVAALATLYGVESPGLPMLPEVEVTAAALACDALRVGWDPCNFKLFFHRAIEGRSAELYLNTQLRRKTLQLQERDARYRRNIVRALTERA